jgi:predicted nucleic acid-binding protein
VTRFVVDAAVLLRIAEGTVAVHPDHALVAPSGVRSQAVSALYAAVRRGELERAVALERLERITEIKIRLLNDRVSRRRAWEIAERLGWPDTADAEYAAVTQLQADAFVTLDRELARRLDGVVPLAALEALGAPE